MSEIAGVVVITNDLIDMILTVAKAMKDILFAGVGGVIAYLYEYQTLSKKDASHKWSTRAMIINMLLGSFVGYTVGSFIDVTSVYREGLIGLAGVSAYSILGVVENPDFVRWVIERFFGGANAKDK